MKSTAAMLPTESVLLIVSLFVAVDVVKCVAVAEFGIAIVLKDTEPLALQYTSKIAVNEV